MTKKFGVKYNGIFGLEELKQLDYLSLSDNQLTSLPESIGELK